MRKLRSTFFLGLALAVPITILGFAIYRVFKICKGLISPIAVKLGIDHLLGRATISVFAILLILLLILILGLSMKISFVVNTRKMIEDAILNFVPALNHLKVLVSENIDAGNSQDIWKPALVLMNDRYKAAFIVEEDQELITLFICRSNSLKIGEVVTVNRKNVHSIQVSYQELYRYCRSFGKGFISVIKKQTDSENINHK